MIVLDASAAVELLLERGPVGEWARARVARADSVHAPHLIDLEVAATLLRLARAREITASLGRLALSELMDMPIRRYPATRLLERIWRLRGTLTAYDAAYVALAEALDAPLVTTDRHLAQADGHGARIEAFLG